VRAKRRGIVIRRSNVVRASLLAFAALTASNARAQPHFEELRLIAPAAPGGGWDQTGRALAAAMQFADHSEVELERLQAERASEKRRQRIADVSPDP